MARFVCQPHPLCNNIDYTNLHSWTLVGWSHRLNSICLPAERKALDLTISSSGRIGVFEQAVDLCTIHGDSNNIHWIHTCHSCFTGWLYSDRADGGCSCLDQTSSHLLHCKEEHRRHAMHHLRLLLTAQCELKFEWMAFLIKRISVLVIFFLFLLLHCARGYRSSAQFMFMDSACDLLPTVQKCTYINAYISTTENGA